MLGFEGDGLALVEELLKPGTREALLDDLQGGAGVSHTDCIRRLLTLMSCVTAIESK